MDRNMRNNHQMMSSGGMTKRMQSQPMQQQPLLQQPHQQPMMQPPQQHHQQQQHQQQHRDTVAQHDELIKYIDEAWHKVTTEQANGGPKYYKNTQETETLSDFKEFDLELYWGNRAHQSLQKNRSHQ